MGSVGHWGVPMLAQLHCLCLGAESESSITCPVVVGGGGGQANDYCHSCFCDFLQNLRLLVERGRDVLSHTPQSILQQLKMDAQYKSFATISHGFFPSLFW